MRKRSHREEVTRYEDYEIRVIGAEPPGPEDLYHLLLTAPWTVFLGVIVGSYLGLNALFAGVYLFVGGVQGVKSFADAFFFSVQTMGTIGYGAMTPVTVAANTAVVVESVTGLVVTALSTGLVFVRFSRSRAKIRFSSRAAITPVDGATNLTLRVGNVRRAPIVDVSFRLTLVRTTITKEGVTLYRAEQLPLVHDRAPLLTRSLTLRHVLDDKSPLLADTPRSFEEADIELVIAASGTDESTLQPVHARKTWAWKNVVWGARLADLMSEPTPNHFVLDVSRFHDLVPSEATEAFPYQATPESLSPPTE